MELRFNLFFAVFQSISALVLALSPVIVFLAVNPDQYPLTNALWCLGVVTLPAGGLAYFGIRGLSRSVQIRVTEEGLSGRLVSKDGKVINWTSVAFAKYKGDFLETIRVELHDKRRIVIRDLSQLYPWSLLEVFEVARTRLETGRFTIPKKNRWWHSTWFALLGVMVVSIVLITAANWFRGR